MKRLAFFLVLVLFSSSIFSQGEEGGESHSQCELNFQIFNNNNQFTVDFVTTPVWNTINEMSSSTYLAGAGCNFAHIWPQGYQIATRTISLQGITNLCTDNGFHYGTTPPGQVGCSSWPNYSASNFQSGLYYVVVKVNGVEKTHFYYDNRNGQFPSNPCNLPGITQNDIGVRYDVTSNQLYYIHPPTSVNHQDPTVLGFKKFQKGEVLNWWEITETETGLNFSGFYTRYFAILEIDCINNAPFLSWQVPNVSDPISHYELQRWGGSSFQTIYTTTSNLSYHDNTQIGFCDPNSSTGYLRQYRVVTIYEDELWPHEFSNIQKILITKGLSKDNLTNIENSSFSLEQNYPNPFNPTTKISYNIPSNGFVSLKVYNSLGQEIKTLVSENQGEGKYEIDFNAEFLPSGIYFYRLAFGDYVSIQKMIYLQ